MQKRFCGEDVRALARQRRREAHRQLPRQLQPFELELGKVRRIGGEPAGQDRKQVARLGKPLLQGRHGHPRLGHLRALGKHLDERRASELQLPLDERELLLFRRQDSYNFV